MKSGLFAGAWLATLAVTFFVGRTTAPELRPGAGGSRPRPVRVPERDAIAEYREEAQPVSRLGVPEPEPGSELETCETDCVRSEPHSPRPAESEPPPSATEPARGDFVAVSSAFRAYVAKQFTRGPDGTMDIVREMDRLLIELRKSDIDDRQAVREFYPWIKFLVAHESETVDFLQCLLTLMAETPALFEGLDDNGLEVILESFPMMLPGIVSEERLSTFRALADRILAMPKDQLPKAIRANLREIERALTFDWAAPIDSEGVVQAIRSGSLQPGQALLALKRIDLAALSVADRTETLRVAMDADAWQVIKFMTLLAPASVDGGALDPAMARNIANRRAAPYVDAYSRALGRGTWSEVRPLLESALAQSGKAAEAVVWSLVRLKGGLRPDDTWLRDFLTRYELSESARSRLEQAYKLR